jgi:Cu2+-containing amine oxidase
MADVMNEYIPEVNIKAAILWVQDEEQEYNRRRIDYLFPAINREQSKTVKVYDAETGQPVPLPAANTQKAAAKTQRAKAQARIINAFWTGFLMGMGLVAIVMALALFIVNVT